MTPTKTTYTISSEKTGCTQSSCGAVDQTINPSKLDLWRVIKKNEDGTIEMVSEYTSNEDIWFRSKEGYNQYIATLNEVADSYQNPNYTSKARYMGYSGQTGDLTGIIKYEHPAPWSTNTSNNDNETVGGGDTMHEADVTLVHKAIGSLIANKQGTTTSASYWLASRYYYYYGSTDYYTWGGRFIDNNGNLLQYHLYRYSLGEWLTPCNKYSLRPIVTLKANLEAMGNGTSSSPWVLN